MIATQKNKVLTLLQALQKTDGSFCFSNTTSSTCLSTSFAVMIYYLLEKQDDLDVTSLKKLWNIDENIEAIQIKDPVFFFDDLKGQHKPDYLKNQITYFSLIALDTVGITFKNIEVANPFLESEKDIEAWFSSLDLRRFWYESNNIMFTLYYMFYLKQYGTAKIKNKASSAIEVIMGLLNSSQDPNTGYWGTNLNNNNLLDGCFGASHIYLYYDYLNQEIPFLEKIIDNTLSLHNKKGLLGSKYGGACEDYDAIEIYLRCLKQTDYRKSDIHCKLEQMYETISSSVNSDGGFSYRITNSNLRKVFKRDIQKNTYSYSGWSKMKTNAFKTDLWATWFRYLSLEVIDHILKSKSINSYHLPGWGYIQRL